MSSCLPLDKAAVISMASMAADARGAAAEELARLLAPQRDPGKAAAQRRMKEEQKSVVCMFFFCLQTNAL